MEFRPLGQTGLQVSILGFGSSPLGGEFGPIDEAEGIRTVHAAIDVGINLFDVSPYYGRTKAETVLGRALRSVGRDRYVVATKVGRYDRNDFDFSAARVTRGVDESLGRLGVEVIDLIQCHDIEFGSLDQVIEETLPALEALRVAGKVRFIGITGLPLKIFRTVLDRAQVDTVLSYCRFTLVDRALGDLLPAFAAKGAGVINASPLAMGLLTSAGPPIWHPASPALKAAARAAAELCRSRGADIANLALSFALNESRIASTLVGMSDRATLRRNLDCVGTAPDPELLKAVEAILAPVHNVSWLSGRPENNDPDTQSQGRVSVEAG